MINVSDDGHVADISPLVHDSTNLREGERGERERGREGGREGEREGGREGERGGERERGGGRKREQEKRKEMIKLIKCFMNVIPHYSAVVGMHH